MYFSWLFPSSVTLYFPSTAVWRQMLYLLLCYVYFTTQICLLVTFCRLLSASGPKWQAGCDFQPETTQSNNSVESWDPKRWSVWIWELSTVLNLLFKRPTTHMRSNLVKRPEVLTCPFSIFVFLCVSLTSLKLAGLSLKKSSCQIHRHGVIQFHFTLINVNPWMFPNETSGHVPDAFVATEPVILRQTKIFS